MVWTIDYGRGKLSTSIRNIQMVFIVVPEKVTEHVAAMTPVRQKMLLGHLIAASKEHCSLNQDIPKGYAIAFKMCTPILVTKLEGGIDMPNSVPTIRSTCFEYNS